MGRSGRDRWRLRSLSTTAAAAVVAIGALGLVAASSVVAPAPVGAVIDNPDLDTAADYTFRVDPEGGDIEVTIEMSVTADRANRTTSTGYYQYYFDGTLLAIPSGVGDLRVVDGAGRELSYEVDSTIEDVDDLIIGFRSNVYYRQSTQVIVTFTLPGGEPRSDGLTRVNGAYAGFQAWVDPRLEEATVTIITPDGFVDRSIGSDFFSRPTDHDEDGEGGLWFVAEGIDPENYWAGVSLSRDESLVTTDIEIGEHGVEVQAWPGDDEWQRFVSENLEAGLPELIDLVGLPWPLKRELTIVESFAPYLNGYAGWYDAAVDEIEIGDELDTHVMFHELSHVWFNGRLFEERWITEGLADEFGAEMVETTGGDRPDPPRSSLVDAVAEPLNTWTRLTDDVDLESWSYGASWTVTEAIAGHVGHDGLSEVIQAADDDRIAYVGDGEAETEIRRNDWRLYLDLLANRDGVDDDELTDLFVDWVLTSAQVDDVEERAASRETYVALQEAGEAWAPPLAVRRAMSAWEFDEADQLMEAASGVLAERARVVEALVAIDGRLPATLETAYEQADEDMVGSAELTATALAVAEHLGATRQAIDDAGGPLQWIGSIGSGNDAELAEAVGRFEAGSFDEAVTRAEAIDADVVASGRRGLIRLALFLAGILAIGTAVLAWRRRRRRGRPAETERRSEVLLLPTGQLPLPEITAGEINAGVGGSSEGP